MIKINMAKAREIRKEQIRREREPLFAALDAEYIRALETGDQAKISEVVTKKQVLRAATNDPALLRARSIKTLKEVDPLLGVKNG